MDTQALPDDSSDWDSDQSSDEHAPVRTAAIPAAKSNLVRDLLSCQEDIQGLVKLIAERKGNNAERDEAVSGGNTTKESNDTQLNDLRRRYRQQEKDIGGAYSILASSLEIQRKAMSSISQQILFQQANESRVNRHRSKKNGSKQKQEGPPLPQDNSLHSEESQRESESRGQHSQTTYTNSSKNSPGDHSSQTFVEDKTSGPVGNHVQNGLDRLSSVELGNENVQQTKGITQPNFLSKPSPKHGSRTVQRSNPGEESTQSYTALKDTPSSKVNQDESRRALSEERQSVMEEFKPNFVSKQASSTKPELPSPISSGQKKEMIIQPNFVRKTRTEKSSMTGDNPEKEEQDIDLQSQTLDPNAVTPLRFQLYETLVQLANEEGRKASATKDAEAHLGINTVLCIDTSSSMAGEPFQQMCGFLTRYIQHAEKDAKEANRYEHFAVVTFGHTTGVLQHFSIDYQKVLECIRNLKIGGPSPLLGGLMYSAFIIEGGGYTVSLHEYPVSPRILLITDGWLTEPALISGPDVTPEGDNLVHKQLVTHHVQRLGVGRKKIFVAPVGDYDNQFLLQLTKITSGAMLDDETKQNQFIRSFKNYEIAGQQMRDPFLFFLRRDMQEQVSALDKVDIDWFTQERRDEKEDQLDDQYMELELEDLLPIGSRVRRGPDMRAPDDVDKDGPGTVVGHRLDGFLHVCWDTDKKGVYRYGDEKQAYDLVLVEQPRVLKAEESIAVGCYVTRGKDWSENDGDEDGGLGNIGVVYRVHEFGLIRVKWPSGSGRTYKYGFEDIFEVEVCDKPREVTQTKSPSSQPHKVASAPAQRPSQRALPALATQKRNLSVESKNKNVGTFETKVKPAVKTTREDTGKTNDVGYQSSSTELLHVKRAVNTKGTKESQDKESPGESQQKVQDGATVGTSKGQTYVQWQYKDKELSDKDSDWRCFTEENSKKIEVAFQRKPTATILIDTDEGRYRILLAKMEQFHIQSTRRFDVRRIDVIK